MASFLFRHSESKIALQTHIRLPPSAPSFRCSFRPPLLISFPEGYQVLHAPQPICDSSVHSWGPAKRTMNVMKAVVLRAEPDKETALRKIVFYRRKTLLEFVSRPWCMGFIACFSD